MDQLKKSIPDWLMKYKYVILVVVIGIVMMLIPGKKSDSDIHVQVESQSTQTESLEYKIENILSNIRGVGKVKVLLTVSECEQIIYQENEDTQINDNGQVRRTDTVITTDAQRNESGLIQQRIPPKYFGAIIVCQGADDPNVKLSIVDAVTKATGLGANNISVLKMG